MLKGIVSLLFVCISYASFSQVDTIRTLQLINERGGYEKLVERFNNSDTTLTIEEFQLIYYGYQTLKRMNLKKL